MVMAPHNIFIVSIQFDGSENWLLVILSRLLASDSINRFKLKNSGNHSNGDRSRDSYSYTGQDDRIGHQRRIGRYGTT